MKRRFLALALITVILVCMCFGFSGCTKTETCTITFDYNVGNLVYAMEQQQTEVVKNSLISSYPSKGIEEKAIEGYYIEGWYTAKTDESGNILVDSNRFVRLDKKWDFDVDKVSKNLVLFANWEKVISPNQYRYSVILCHNLGNLVEGQTGYGVTFKILENTTLIDPLNLDDAYNLNHGIGGLGQFLIRCPYSAEGKMLRVEGWYTPQIDETTGKIKRDENGFVLLDKKWDLENDIVTGNMNTTTTALYSKLVVVNEES